ncbi:MAG: RnfABCDGE type electron transport complex subunit D, partial [Oscillospiraceae bacterium]
SLREMFLGQRGGSLGEIAAFALIFGGLYLVARGVIRLRIPLCFLGTVAVLTFLFPQGGNDAFQWMSYELLSGGLMLGAIFMATDPVTSPITPMGQVLYGIGCGALTVLLRYFGPYPEGVCGAILGMNMLVWALDKIGVPRRFGTALLPQKSGEVAR